MWLQACGNQGGYKKNVYNFLDGWQCKPASLRNYIWLTQVVCFPTCAPSRCHCDHGRSSLHQESFQQEWCAASIAEPMCMPLTYSFRSSRRDCVIATEISAKGIMLLVPLGTTKTNHPQLSGMLQHSDKTNVTILTGIGSMVCHRYLSIFAERRNTTLKSGGITPKVVHCHWCHPVLLEKGTLRENEKGKYCTHSIQACTKYFWKIILVTYSWEAPYSFQSVFEASRKGGSGPH